MAQEALSKMKQAFAENGKKFGVQKLSFEAVELWIRENRNIAQQAVRAQEKAIQEAERREHEVRRFKEEQKQIMIEKERQARENEREKREHHEKRGGETTRSEHKGNADSIRKISWQSLRVDLSGRP